MLFLIQVLIVFGVASFTSMDGEIYGISFLYIAVSHSTCPYFILPSAEDCGTRVAS